MFKWFRYRKAVKENEDLDRQLLAKMEEIERVDREMRAAWAKFDASVAAYKAAKRAEWKF